MNQNQIFRPTIKSISKCITNLGFNLETKMIYQNLPVTPQNFQRKTNTT